MGCFLPFVTGKIRPKAVIEKRSQRLEVARDNEKKTAKMESSKHETCRLSDSIRPPIQLANADTYFWTHGE